MPAINNPKLGGDLKTVAGERELAELEAHLDKDKTAADPANLNAIREAVRTLGRSIAEKTGASEERRNALNDLKRVFTNAKIAAFR